MSIYNNKHLMTGPSGNNYRETKLTGSQGICYIAGNSLNLAVTAVVGQYSLLPSDVLEFCNVVRSEILEGHSFIVRCHVTLKYPIIVHTVGKKYAAIII